MRVTDSEGCRYESHCRRKRTVLAKSQICDQICHMDQGFIHAQNLAATDLTAERFDH